MAKAVVKKEKTVVATVRAQTLLQRELPPLPEALDGKVDLRGWIASLVAGIPYEMPDEDFLAREMLLNVLTGESLEDALVGAGMAKLQEVVEDFAGNTTGPIRVTDITVARSTVEDGDGTYLIMEWVSEMDGSVTRCTTGAQQVQAGFVRYLIEGIWPIRCQIVRDKATDQGGRHLLKVWPADL